MYETHRWVVEELALAIAGGLRVVEVREEGVSDQGGIAGNRQRIPYSETERDKLLVELAATVGNWVRTVDVTLRLLPPEVVEEFRPLLGAPGFRCTYTVLEGNRESAPKETLVRPIKVGCSFTQPACRRSRWFGSPLKATDGAGPPTTKRPTRSSLSSPTENGAAHCTGRGV